MRAIIIGAQGQDGRYVTENLQRAGVEVFGAVRKKFSHLESSPSAQLFEIDMADERFAHEFLNYISPDYIFHLAAIHAPSHSMKTHENEYREAMIACHLGITENLLKWQRNHLRSRSVVALSSQMYVNNPTEGRLINEDTVPDATTPYGDSKIRAWNALKKYRDEFGVQSSGAILFNHTSQRSNSGFLFPTLVDKIHAVLENRSSEIQVVNELAEIDISHAREITDALVKMVLAKNSEDFVLGSGKQESIQEILNKIAIKLQVELKICSENEPQRVQCLKSSIGKAKSLLGWEPTLAPVQILSEMIQSGASRRE